jgi:hypothetical protein
MEFPDARYEGLHSTFLLTGSNREKFTELIECDLFDQINVLRRIGSDSMFGTAWLSVLETEDFQPNFVIKVQKNIPKALEEFRIQSKLSTSSPDNFLIPYKSINCDNISFNDKGKSVSIKNGNFIFMEVAQGDLEQLLKFDYVNDQTLIEFILQIIDGVEIMALNSIYHGDLHIRQIFIVTRNCKTRAVIGDFGESIEIVSVTTHLSDIGYFLGSLNETLDNLRRKYSSFDKKLESAIKHLDKLKKINNKLPDDMDLQDVRELVVRDLASLRNIFQ